MATTDTRPRTLRASIDIAAPPADVWRVVADLRRTPEWSPECRRVVPLTRVHQGGWLLGVNRRGRVWWTTASRLTTVEPEREIAWVVKTNRSVWTYRLEALEGGTRVTETRETPQGEGRFARWFTTVLLGGKDSHDTELEAGMARGLERIRDIVAAGA